MTSLNLAITRSDRETEGCSTTMPNKSLDVLYALRGLNPPLDAAGVLIAEGDWVIRALAMGQVAGLIFARAFPQEPAMLMSAGSTKHDTPATSVKVTTYGISTDDKSYQRGVVQRGTVAFAHRMLVIGASQVPAAVRAVLSGTEDELKALYKARTKIDI